MVLDDRRVVVAKAQDKGLKKLESDKEVLKTEIKNKKKELNTSSNVTTWLSNQLKDAQTEVTNLKAKVLEKKKTELKEKKKKQGLDEAEQRGYDLCFKEQLATIKQIQGNLYQASYDFGFDEALIPSSSALRVVVSIPPNFKYVEDPEIKENGEGECKGSQAGDNRRKKAPACGDNAGGATTEDDVEDTSNHDLTIHVD